MNDALRLAAENSASGRTFGSLVQDVARLMKRHFERRARQNGLPITRWQATVIIYISRHEGVSQAEVAAWLNIEPIALVRLLDKLCEEGLVVRRGHPTDRRVRTLWLTAAAQPVLERILEINQMIRAEAFVGLPDSARDSLIESLVLVRDNLASVVADDAAAAELPADA